MTATSMGSRARSRLVAATAIALTVLATRAGDAMAAPSAAERETARRLMDEGKERSRVGDKERAIEAYQKAHDIMKVPTTGIALAKAQLAVGHLVEARDVALEVARMPRENGEPTIFEKSRREAKELEASIKPRIPTVRIIVKGGPATRVSFDGGAVASLLLGEPVAMNPGKHSIIARNADGAERRTEVELAERDAKEVELTLPVPTPALVVAPVPERPRSAGETDRGRTTGANVLVFGGVALAVVGLGIGGVTGALTLSKAGDVKTQCANGICDPAAKTDLDSANSLATISTIGFAVGGAGALCVVVGLLLPRSRAETALQSPEKRAAVWIGPGSMGVRGSF
ncbi:MAG: hypothetical protein JWO86_2524 [Myxococcaceae bacterium]|nr:hypothetical protein [Myxococcaceae bacterium]MEA2749191.1 hypothetical protein [Myxococcales bacterium]